MECRSLGKSGLKVSPLCLGGMMFGGATDEPTARRIVDRARQQGVTFVDTADGYGGGKSEEIVGRAIRERRSWWVLATKCANPTGPGPNARGLSRRHVFDAVEASLRRLGTEVIDLLYLHKEDHATPMEETVHALADLSRAGKIRHFGVSNFRSLARRRTVPPVRRRRHRPSGSEPAAAQRIEPRAEGGAFAGLRLFRAGGGALQPLWHAGH